MDAHIDLAPGSAGGIAWTPLVGVILTALAGLGGIAGIYADSRSKIAENSARISGIESWQGRADAKLDRILEKLGEKADRR